MDRAHEVASTGSRPAPPDPFTIPCCASCGDGSDLSAYGAALFCAECRAMSETFYRKDLYCDLGGGD